MFKKAVPVSDLKLGMYVIELDRPWLGTPFDFQGFPLTSQDQIAQLKEYCQVVYIDPDREPWTPERRKAALGFRGDAVYADATPVEKEVVTARDIYRSCEIAIQHALEGLRSHGEIDSQKLTGAVSSMTE